MKLLIFTAFFFPHKGGVERYVFELSKRLCQKRIEVSVITCNTEKSLRTETIEGITIYRLDAWNLLGGQYPIPKISYKNLLLIRKLSSHQYNVLNGHTRFYITTLMGLLFAWYCRIPYYHTEHGTTHTVFSNILLSFIARLYDHTIGRLVISRAEKVIVVSEAAGHFAQHLGAKEFSVVYNGVDTSFFQKISPSLSSKWGISSEGYLITFIGRLIYAKGVQDLIEVFKELESRHTLNLLIVGDGDHRQALEILCSNQPNIRFIGEKGQEDIREILSATDILVNPSYSEGLPTAILEAGGCECCVIASDAGGTFEIIDPGSNGLIYPAKDTKALKNGIESLLHNDDVRIRYGKALRKKIEERFDWEIISDSFIKNLP